MAVPILGEPLGLSMFLWMSLTMGGVVWVLMERLTALDRRGLIAVSGVAALFLI